MVGINHMSSYHAWLIWSFHSSKTAKTAKAYTSSPSLRNDVMGLVLINAGFANNYVASDFPSTLAKFWLNPDSLAL